MEYRRGQIVGYVALPKLVDTSEPERWRVINIVPQREFTVAKRLAKSGIRCYVPREKQTRIIRGRKIDMVAPVFPRIGFVAEDDAPSIAMLREITNGISSFVQFGDWIAVADGRVMERVRQLEAYFALRISERKRAARRDWSVGEHVRVISGPFASFCARFEQLDSKGRVRILLSLFGREFSAEFDEEQIEPI